MLLWLQQQSQQQQQQGHPQQLVTPVVCHTASGPHYDLVKSRHAFYVVTSDSLFVLGSPSRLFSSQSAAGLL